ncbi:tyrosine-type recombinase/integrase [Limnoglobus roseus]|uniref:Site-specific integrase n=1 Tax=Limnoglobus roseus TaxID=2598579 RepID=A0A5C1AKY0_9BACT|nr:tyrosine-type recombinase/integrase [Limnoglobus roseus]QEL18837.1 site-specific integrase [Limnoglobus roseus]
MGSLLHPTYTAPIPKNAERVKVKGRPCVRFASRGKVRTLPLSEDGTRVVKQAAKWYGQYVDADGTTQRKPLARDKEAARQLLAEIEKKVERRRSGLVDVTDEHARRPLLEHLDDYEAILRAKGDTDRHIVKTVYRIRSVLVGCRFAFPGEVDSSKVAAWLSALREGSTPAAVPDWPAFTPAEAAEVLGITTHTLSIAVKRHGLAATGKSRARRLPRETVTALAAIAAEGVGPATQNHYLRALRGFFRWLAKGRRIALNPLDGLELVCEEVDIRHARRELDLEELRTIFAATRGSNRTFRGLDGVDRHVVYALAVTTGFRTAALASLTADSIDLAARTVTLSARANKSRKAKVQPLTPDAAELLAEYLRARPRRGRLWPGSWAGRSADMLKADLEEAGIPYVVEGRDGTPLHADFHALRHSFLTIGGRSGIDLRTLQELAGHSTPVLTARYMHVGKGIWPAPSTGCPVRLHCRLH